MSGKEEKIQVQLKYKDIEQQFSAQPQEAWLLISKFFINLIPAFEIAQKLSLSIDLQQLAKDLHGLLVFATDGVSFLLPKNKLTDNEALSIWLTAYFLGSKLGLVATDSLSKDELHVKLGKSSKITSTRLGELVKSGVVQKTNDENFRITTYGIALTQKDVIPKIKSKIAV